MKRRQISPERKLMYYGGMVLIGIGVLLFLSTFVSGVMSVSQFGDDFHSLNEENFGDFTGKMHGLHSQGRSIMLRAVFGMIMMVVGGGLMKVGAKGPAGAGLVLDPEQARRDVEPWSRATGGMIKDGLDEAGIHLENIVAAKAVETDGNNQVTSTNFGDKLRELHRLYEEGILSQEEYEREKRDVLDKI